MINLNHKMILSIGLTYKLYHQGFDAQIPAESKKLQKKIFFLKSA